MDEPGQLHGVLVVDKPAGPTSHDVVARVRRSLGARKAGHTGTLDPFATGVLPVCLGRATRLARFLAEGEKAYQATVRIGFATTTDDRDGEPLEPPRAVRLDAAAVRAACASLVGPLLQRPPAYSAKRVAGRRAYDLARSGTPAPLAPVRVTVYALDVTAVVGDLVEIAVRCAPGTYVRALARDLGVALGLGAHLDALRRTRSGGFGLEQAVAWDEIDAAAGRLLPLRELLPGQPAVRVGAEGRRAVQHGRDLPSDLVLSGFPEPPAPPRLRVLDEAGELLALAVPRGFDPPAQGLPIAPVLHPDVVLLGA